MIAISISDKVAVTAYLTVVCCQQRDAAFQLKISGHDRAVFAQLSVQTLNSHRALAEVWTSG